MIKYALVFRLTITKMLMILFSNNLLNTIEGCYLKNIVMTFYRC